MSTEQIPLSAQKHAGKIIRGFLVEAGTDLAIVNSAITFASVTGSIGAEESVHEAFPGPFGPYEPTPPVVRYAKVSRAVHAKDCGCKGCEERRRSAGR